MQVYKFGGASVKDADGIKNLCSILKHEKESVVVVISAMGKMTNALEKVVDGFVDGKDVSDLLTNVKQYHLDTLTDLGLTSEEVWIDINDTFVEVEWILEDEIQDSYDYLYDQIVSLGEVLSTKIVSHYMRMIGQSVEWLDVRDVLITDACHRYARVDWQETEARIQKLLRPKLEEAPTIVITQGFIGSTDDNHTTTLGREGSDYTAGILSYCLNAESLTIWKDVPGILNADPRKFENTIKIPRIDYREAIEMTYFGAKVIHPKTIKPLQNKNIPLYVKPFMAPTEEGTMITADIHQNYPPIIVVEENQCLIHISTKDFSFMAEQHLADIFSACDRALIKINMMRNSAISFTIAVGQDPKKLAYIKDVLQDTYNILIDEDLKLLTIRHFNEETVAQIKKNKLVILEERLEQTIRMAVKELPPLKMK